MKLHYRVTILAVTLIGVMYLIWQSQKETSLDLMVQKKMISREASLGTKDDPEARVRLEFEQLKDPSTGEIPRGIRARELAYASTIPTKEALWARGLAKTQAPFNWTKRGPLNVGGRTRGFAPDMRNANILLAGGVSGGMWRSTDDGATWVKTTAPDQLHSVTSLVQDPRTGQQDVWYAGTGERSGNSAGVTGAPFRGNGIFKSTDNGVSWTSLTSTASNTPQTYDNAFDFVNRIAIDPTDGEIYAAASNMILKSMDAGGSWSTVRGSLDNNSATDVQVTTAGVVYAAINSSVTNPGIWRSTDGNTWTSITPAGFPTVYSRIYIAIAPSNQNAVYFLVQGTNGTNLVDQINGHQIWKYTYVSGDGTGAAGTWVNKGVSLPNEPYSASPTDFKNTAVYDTQGGYDIHMDVKPNDENFVVLGGVNLYKTADFSVTTPTWTRIGGYVAPNDFGLYLNHHPDLHSGFFRLGSNIIYYSGHDGGLTKTLDVTAGTVSWSSLNNGYVTTQFYTVAIDRGTSGNNVVIGGTQDNGTWWTSSTSSTDPWIATFSGDGSYCAIADGRTSYYMSAQSGNMYRILLDASGNWTGFTKVAPTGGGPYLFINPFVLDPNNTNMMYVASGTRVWRNSDLTGIPMSSTNTTSVNWTDMTNTNVTGDNVVSLSISKTPANRLYYATYNSSTGARFLRRVDGANSGDPIPTDVTGSNFPTQSFLICIAVNPSDADQAIAVFSNYSIPSLFYTTNGGSSWTDVSGNLEQNPNGSGNGPSCRWAAIMPTAQGTTYFVGTSTGLYSTTTLSGGTTSWVQEGGTTIGNVVVAMIDYRTTDGLVVAATHGNGIYSSNILTSTAVARSTIPSSFDVAHNFPNPFNPTTTIQYSVSERSRVRLSVFDLAGKEIAVLLDALQDPGYHEARWNAKDARGQSVSSGVYFYRMTANGTNDEVLFSRVKKMTFVK